MLDVRGFGKRSVIKKRASKLALWALVLLPLAFLGLFFYWPLAELVARGLSGAAGPTLQRITAIFADVHLQRVMIFTAKQAAISAAASIAIGFPLAYVLTAYDFRGKRLVKSLTIIPFTLPAVTVALGFILLFGNNGALNHTLMSLFGWHSPPIPILYSLTGIVLAHAFYNAPIVTRTTAAAWERLSPDFEESARALGAPRWQVFWRITLPMLVPSIASGGALAFIYAFLSFPIVLVLGGARFTTLEVEIYRRAIVSIDLPGAAALATVALAIALLFTLGYLSFERRYAHRVRLAGVRATKRLWQGVRALGNVRTWGLYLGLGLAAFFFLGPILVVIVDSFTRQWQDHTIFTLQWYRTVFEPTYSSLIAASPLQSILNSLSFAVTTTVMALSAGTALSVALWRSRSKGKTSLETIGMAPLAISSVALGLALLLAFTRAPLAISGTWIAIVIAHTLLAIPFVIRVVRPALERLEPHLGEAARALGASAWTTAVRIWLPLVRSSLVVAAAFAFAISIAEMSATIMLIRPDLLTMPLSVYYLLSARQFGAASAMSVLMVLVLALAFVLIERFGERPVRS